MKLGSFRWCFVCRPWTFGHHGWLTPWGAYLAVRASIKEMRDANPDSA